MQASRGELKGTRRLPGRRLETAVLQIHMNPNRVAAQFTQGFRLRDPRPPWWEPAAPAYWQIDSGSECPLYPEHLKRQVTGVAAVFATGTSTVAVRSRSRLARHRLPVAVSA